MLLLDTCVEHWQTERAVHFLGFRKRGLKQAFLRCSRLMYITKR